MADAVYKIANWNERHETSNTRRFKSRTTCTAPLPFGTDGYRSLLEEFGPESDRIYGAWMALVAIATTTPKRGVLALESGDAMTTRRMSTISGLPVATFDKLMVWAVSVGWIAPVGIPLNAKAPKAAPKKAETPQKPAPLVPKPPATVPVVANVAKSVQAVKTPPRASDQDGDQPVPKLLGVVKAPSKERQIELRKQTALIRAMPTIIQPPAEQFSAWPPSRPANGILGWGSTAGDEVWLAVIGYVAWLAELRKDYTAIHANLQVIELATLETVPEVEAKLAEWYEIAKPPELPTRYTREYLQFWDAFPRKVGKTSAYREWHAALLTIKNNWQKLVFEAKCYRLKHDAKSSVTPYKWLNERMWEPSLTTETDSV